MKTQISHHILAVDDDAQTLRSLAWYLKQQGYGITACATAREAMEHIKGEVFDLLLTDMRMAPIDGIELLKFSREHCPDLPVIMFTGFADIPTAIECLRSGAYDYLTKPLKLDMLKAAIASALSSRGQLRGSRRPSTLTNVDYRFGRLVAKSAAMIRLCDLIQRISPCDVSLLIDGEPGTEKDLAAAVIHAESRRANLPFVTVRCETFDAQEIETRLFGSPASRQPGQAGRGKGLLQGRFNGTLYLSGLDRLPFVLQERLWNALEGVRNSRRYAYLSNVSYPRVLASTTDVMSRVYNTPQCCHGLFLHLGAITVQVPPLRERPEDISGLTAWILSLQGEQTASMIIEDAVYAALRRYVWPGNLEELYTVVTTAAVAAKNDGGVLRLRHLPSGFADDVSEDMPRLPADRAPDAGKGRWLKQYLRDQSKELSDSFKDT